MEQNRKKIRIQKVVLSLLSVIFLAMALAGISAMYLNGGYGRGISWVYEETYEEQDGLIVPTEVRVTMYPATTDHQKPQTGGVTYVVNTAYTIASGEIQEKQFTCDGTTYTLTRDGDSWKYGGNVLSTENRFDDTTIPGMRIDTENMLIYPPFKAPSQQPAVGPASHDTVPTIANQQGLTIQKKDSEGALLEGATLSLKKVQDGTETVVGGFDGTQANQTLNIGLNDLADIHVAGASQNPYYVLEEIAAPSAEYELAKESASRNP